MILDYLKTLFYEIVNGREDYENLLIYIDLGSMKCTKISCEI